MPTTIIFNPSNATVPPFSTQITMDGASYTLSAGWNVYRQDWYYTLTDLTGSVVVSGPLIGSPDNSDIYLAPGIFTTSTLLYRTSSNQFEVGP